MPKLITLLESLRSVNLNEADRRRILLEYPYGLVNSAVLPPQYSFLSGLYIDFGFENIGKVELGETLNRDGLRIPGTLWKMVKDANSRLCIIPAAETDQELPADWLDGAYAFIPTTNEPVWVGKKVRENQIQGFDVTLIAKARENAQFVRNFGKTHDPQSFL